MIVARCSEINAEKHFMFHTSFRLITVCFMESCSLPWNCLSLELANGADKSLENVRLWVSFFIE